MLETRSSSGSSKTSQSSREAEDLNAHTDLHPSWDLPPPWPPEAQADASLAPAERVGAPTDEAPAEPADASLAPVELAGAPVGRPLGEFLDFSDSRDTEFLRLEEVSRDFSKPHPAELFENARPPGLQNEEADPHSQPWVPVLKLTPVSSPPPSKASSEDIGEKPLMASGRRPKMKSMGASARKETDLPLSGQKPSLPGVQEPEAQAPSDVDNAGNTGNAGNAAAAPAAPAASKRSTVLQYSEGECPENDLLALRGGSGMPVIVVALAPGGKAEAAGFKAGTKMLSINGSSDFQALSASEVQEMLVAPVSIELEHPPLTANSPRCKEIRLVTKKPEEKLGMSLRCDPWTPEDKVMLVEEVVFNAGAASTWLRTASLASDGKLRSVRENAEEMGTYSITSMTQVRPGTTPRLYELHPREAHRVVGHAMRTAWSAVAHKAELVATPGGRSSHDGSELPLCGCAEWARDTVVVHAAQIACEAFSDCKMTVNNPDLNTWV
eukprot:TRINITY_DN33346_c0_g1_i1.p1 TRINITY_DN33346_c0_g1~~TRINITY_DN33346_c0_g1_i1.p1  ORF type:complete len:496 (-),score=122.89 TRINITY_DN33346_c0_g1_i1:36-1523(-)